MPLFIPIAQAVGVSGGNTSGNTGVDQGTIAFAGGSNVTLSQATDSVGASITVNAAGGTLNRFDNLPSLGTASNQTNSPYVTLGTVNGSMHLFPLTPPNMVFPGVMTASTMYFDMSQAHTNTSATTQALTYRYSVGVYTLSGASTLSLLNSGSASVTAAATSNQSTLWNGARYLTLDRSAFSASLTFSQANYWLGIIMSSSGTTNSNFGFFGAYPGNQGVARSGTMGVSGTTNNSRDWSPWAGIVATAALPASIHISGVTKTGTSGGFIPHVILEATHSAW